MVVEMYLTRKWTNTGSPKSILPWSPLPSGEPPEAYRGRGCSR
jgi:hypothetical protein